MGYTLVSGPTATDIVTLTEVKNHLRVTGTDEDTYLTSLIERAVNYWRTRNGWEFTTATWKLEQDDFPSGTADAIRLKRGPVQSVTTVKYFDSDNVQQTLVAGADYTVDATETPAWIIPGDDGWPDVYDRTNAVEIIFVAGYGDAGSPNPVPEGVQHGILMSIDWWFWHRGEDIPIGLHNYMAEYRLAGFGA